MKSTKVESWKLKVAGIALVAMVATSAAGGFPEGKFLTGCNYWASNAGMYMWRQWDAKTVEKDIAELSANGVNVLRVFPLWPDFQPLTRLLDGRRVRGYLQNDRPLQNEAAVDEEMMRRFRFMCDVAAKHDVRLVVGLITGWMSGREFFPQGLEGRNVLTDPECIIWEVRFVRHFVREMKDHSAIVGWDLGNECNCMAGAERAQFWCWMYQIASAIRLEDATRPVVSGMHSIKTSIFEQKNLRDHGELMDVLTTHPYPLFTPMCAVDPFNSMRSELHPSAESLLYAGLSGKPCFVEEAGDLGRCTASAENSGASMRAAMWSAWANGLGAYVWWCAFDQQHLDFPPYTWNAVERELGLFTADYQPKPVLNEMKQFRAFLKDFPHADLPKRRVDAVCVVSELENQWEQAFGAFLLSRQAGFDVTFVGGEQLGKSSNRRIVERWSTESTSQTSQTPQTLQKLYIVPSGSGWDPLTKEAWDRVFAKAEQGATVLVSKGREARFSDFARLTGNRLETFCRQPLNVTMTLDGSKIFAHDTTTTRLAPVSSKVLAAAEDGSAMVTVAPLGKGKVVFVNFALELHAIERGDSFTGEHVNPLYRIYRAAKNEAGIVRTVEKDADVPFVGLTEHKTKDATVIVAINYEPRAVKCPIALKGTLGTVWRGKVTKEQIDFDANGIAVFEVR